MLASSCRESVGEEECGLYALCEQLITKNGDVVKDFIELDLKEFGTDTSNSNSASGSGSNVQYPSGSTGVNVEDEVDSFITSLGNACSESYLKTVDGLQKCHSKCQAHLCCFTTNSEVTGQDCSVHPAACSAYAPCERLVTPPAGTEPVSSTALSTPEETEKRVYDACYFGDDPTKVTEGLVTKCHGVCAQRLCCFSDYILQSSCRDTVGDDECKLYSLCDQLVTESGVTNDALELEEKEFGVDQLCTDKVAIDVNLYSACRETCERRSCCFETDPIYSCYSMEKDWCDEYKACAVVEYFFDGGSSGEGSLDNNNAADLVGSSGSEHELYAFIESVCSLDSLKTLEGIEQCFNKCQPYLCCFPEDAAEMKWDCEDFRDEECSAYGNCEQLVALHDLWIPPPKAVDKYAVKIAVNGACILGGDQPTEEWVSNCHEKCETRMCCLVDPSIRSSCLDFLGAEECNDYSACKVLIGGDAGGAEKIEDVCSYVDDASSFAECEAKCKTRQCCFEDVHKFSCYHLEKEWCDEYEICGMVGLKLSSTSSNAISSPGAQITAPTPSQSFSHNTMSVPTQSISPGVSDNGPISGSSIENHQDSIEAMKSRCALGNLQENLEDCGKWCQQYECCFYFTDSCANTQPQQCDDHLVCENVFDELRKGPKSSNGSSSGNKITVNTPLGDSDSELLILARACNNDQLDIDATECRMLCKGSECCFTTHIENNCSRRAAMQTFCLEHIVCADIFAS